MRKSPSVKKRIVATKSVLLDCDGPLAGPKEDGARKVVRSLVRKCGEIPFPWDAI